MLGLSIILGSVERTRLTLETGWRVTGLTGRGIAAVLARLHFSTETVAVAFLLMVTIVVAASGVTALLLSRGRRRPWMFFLPIEAITGISAYAD